MGRGSQRENRGTGELALTSSGLRGWQCQEHSSARGFLEKELHRRYSQRELRTNKSSVLGLKNQGGIVLCFKKEKRQSPEPPSDIPALELSQREQQVDDTGSLTWTAGLFP